MDWRRLSLFIAATGIIYFIFLFVYFLPYQKKMERWKKQQAKAQAERTTATETAQAPTSPSLPVEPQVTTPTVTVDTTPTTPSAEGEPTTIAIQTDLYRVVLTSRGGRPASWQYFYRLPEHDRIETIEMIPQREDLSEPQRELPLELILKENNRRWYPEFNRRIYEYEIAERDDGSTEVVFSSPEIRQLRLVKRYRFRRDDYLTSFEVVLQNGDPSAVLRVNDDDRGLGISWGPGVREFPPEKKGNPRYISTVYGTGDEVGHADPKKAPEPNEGRTDEGHRYEGNVTWAGVTDTYFLAAVFPESFEATAVQAFVRRSNEYTKKGRGNRADAFHSHPFTIAMHNEPFDLPPTSQVSFEFEVFVGPKRPELLAAIGDRTETRMKRVLFYNYWFRWMRALKLGLMHGLDWLYGVVGNYGVAIILLSVLIRILLHPIAHKQMKIQVKIQAEMQKIKPLIEEVNKKYKNDPTKRSQEMMKVYREHGISPFAPLRGCLPMFLQIPVFFALWDLLYQYIDLRGATFLWIDDLSGPDKLVDLTQYGVDFNILGLQFASINLLPILMGVSQHFMSKMTPTPTADPSQKQMMLMFTLMFPILLYNFPAGLFLYWLTTNVWQSLHNIIAKRSQAHSPEAKAQTAK